MKKLSILFIFFTTISCLNAQFEAGIFGGTTFYNGDISVKPKAVLKQMMPAIGAFARYTINESFAVRVQAYRGTIYADERLFPSSNFRLSRGFSFKTPTTEISAQGEWHFLNIDNGFTITDSDPFISIYASAGLGIAMFNPRVAFNEPNPVFDDVSIDKNARYSKTTPVIPLGVGIKMRLGESLRLSLEGGGRQTFTDYLDGISKLSAKKALDYYFYTGVTLSWEFTGGGGGSGSSGGGRRGIFSGGGGGGNWGKTGKKAGCPTF
jgi:uncharacterized membrane protein YgcG